MSPLYAFSARSAGARSSPIATWLVRAVTFSLPAVVATGPQANFALAFALSFSAVDGWFRLRVARSARSLVAEDDALVVSSGLDTMRIAWSDVLAVEVWHRLNRVDYVAVHYRGKLGNSVATCWEQNSRDELDKFVRQCAKRVQASDARKVIKRAHLADRPIYLALLRRLLLDLTVALLVGVVCGAPIQALLLGAAAGLVSTLAAAAPYLRHAQFRWRDNLWWRSSKSGELTPVRVIPRSLRPWVSVLSNSRTP